jgi:hypothetical protein
MTTLNSLIDKLDKGTELHMQSFYYDANGKEITKADYLKAKDDDKEATSKTLFTQSFTNEEIVNRFGKKEIVTKAKDKCEWIPSNKVDSLTIQTKVAGIAGLQSTTFRYLKDSAVYTDRLQNVLRLIRFKMQATAQVNKLMEIRKSIKSMVNAPNARPIKDFADLYSVYSNDKTRLTNTVADICSEVADLLNNVKDDSFDANIF